MNNKFDKHYLEEYKSGHYDDCGDFKAFNPSFINHTWLWENAELNSLLAKANKELGALNTYSELVDNIDVYILMHIRVDANKSSKLEGTHTNLEDDMMNLEDVLPEKRNDVQEIKNYVNAMRYGNLVSDLDRFLNNMDNLPILIKLAFLHYQFETIHPFLDGNGRTGRLIIPLFLLSSKEISKPCFYISNYFEEHKDEYYSKLQRVRTHSEIIPWIKFFLTASIETAVDAKQKFQNALNTQKRYQTYLMEKRYSTKTLRDIISYMYTDPVTNSFTISESISTSVTTVNKHLKTLLDDGIIDELTGNRRNKVYALRDYINAFV